MDKIDLLLCASRILQLSEDEEKTNKKESKIPFAVDLSAGKDLRNEIHLRKSLKKIERNLGYRSRRKKIMDNRRIKCTTIVVGGNRFMRQCSCCGNRETIKWRKGPLGPQTLCNSCGNLWEDRIMDIDLKTGSVKSTLTRFKSHPTLIPLDEKIPSENGSISNSSPLEPVKQ